MREGGPKVRPVQVDVLVPGHIHLFALGTIHLLSMSELTFTREVRGSSLIPKGSINCFSHNTRGHDPNCPEMYFWYIKASPKVR